MTAIENDTLGVNDSDKLLTVDDLCEYLVVSKDFIYDAVRQGRLRASRIARQLRFRQLDVDAFVAANTAPSVGLLAAWYVCLMDVIPARAMPEPPPAAPPERDRELPAQQGMIGWLCLTCGMRTWAGRVGDAGGDSGKAVMCRTYPPVPALPKPCTRAPTTLDSSDRVLGASYSSSSQRLHCRCTSPDSRWVSVQA